MENNVADRKRIIKERNDYRDKKHAAYVKGLYMDDEWRRDHPLISFAEKELSGKKKAEAELRLINESEDAARVMRKQQMNTSISKSSFFPLDILSGLGKYSCIVALVSASSMSFQVTPD